MKIAYLVHNLADPAVQRRIAMFRLGGATVSVAGFRRSDRVPALEGADAVLDLGRVGDGRFLERAFAVARTSLRHNRLTQLIKGSDVIVARSLELLVCAAAHRRRAQSSSPLIYECLDIHRMMLDGSKVGQLLHFIEDGLAGQTAAIMTSSPAFVRHYFSQREALAKVPILLVENKVLTRNSPPPPDAAGLPGPPWRIGWYGALRDRKGFAMLEKLAQRLPNTVQIVLRGIPSEKEFPDMVKGEIARGIRYEGPYRYETDLPSIYGDVHFAWAIDFFEEGLNSEWLLPNRLYESLLYGSVPIALSTVEVGRRLREYGAGIRLGSENPLEELVAVFSKMTPETYADLRQASQKLPRASFLTTENECVELVTRLSKLADIR